MLLGIAPDRWSRLHAGMLALFCLDLKDEVTEKRFVLTPLAGHISFWCGHVSTSKVITGVVRKQYSSVKL
jgi:hypothetical protein